VTVGSIRSGLVETFHPVSAVALDADGAVIATIGGDLDREFFLRSSPKPLQASVAQANGADLFPEQLAVAAASHRGFPVHIAYVESMLDGVGLATDALLCPPDRPASPTADRVWAAQGRTAVEPVFHNCSGKHAGMLRACVARGWSLDYTRPDHPLQLEVRRVAEEASQRSVDPRGVDGCGIPTLRSDVTGLARIFRALVTEPEFVGTTAAIARHTPLTSDGTSPEARLTRWVPSISKGGAEGCIGLGMLEHGLAFAAKSWTGNMAAAVVAIVELMDRIGVLPEYQRDRLAPLARPHVFGGGRPVGSLELIES
jgi:L-asparaginase II